MEKQQALARLQSIVDKEGGFVRLPEPLTVMVWCAGKDTEVKIHAIVDKVTDKYTNALDKECVEHELYAIGEDYTAWHIGFLNEEYMTTLANKLGGLTVEIEYRMKVIISGKDMNEITGKWECLNIEDHDQGTRFVEVVGVVDADTYKDLTDKFDEAY